MSGSARFRSAGQKNRPVSTTLGSLHFFSKSIEARLRVHTDGARRAKADNYFLRFEALLQRSDLLQQAVHLRARRHETTVFFGLSSCKSPGNTYFSRSDGFPSKIQQGKLTNIRFSRWKKMLPGPGLYFTSLSGRRRAAAKHEPMSWWSPVLKGLSRNPVFRNHVPVQRLS